MDRPNPKRSAPSSVINLAAVRKYLRIPTQLAVFILRRAGARIQAQRPGRVDASLPEADHSVELRVSAENIFAKEAEAYRREGEPVPPHVLQDMADWNRKHGRSS